MPGADRRWGGRVARRKANNKTKTNEALLVIQFFSECPSFNLNLWLQRQTVFSDSGFKKSCWAHAENSTSVINAAPPQSTKSNWVFQRFALYAEVPSHSTCLVSCVLLLIGRCSTVFLIALNTTRQVIQYVVPLYFKDITAVCSSETIDVDGRNRATEQRKETKNKTWIKFSAELSLYTLELTQKLLWLNVVTVEETHWLTGDSRKLPYTVSWLSNQSAWLFVLPWPLCTVF